MELNYKEQIQLLEQEAHRNPAAYRKRVTLFALLGYSYIIGCVALLCGLLVFGCMSLNKVHNAALIKLLIVLGIAIFLVGRSLWVRFGAPTGITLEREQAPRLFEMIDEIRDAGQCPHIDEVVIDGDYNCAIAQIPRLGLFGYHKNYLILGLPLMESLSPRHFKSVLAHEFGHLSALDGKLGCWIYQVQRTWDQVMVNLQDQRLVNFLFTGFAKWFYPRFDAQSFVLRRQHELAADKFAAHLTDEKTTAQALIITAVKGQYLSSEFWDEQFKQVRKLPEPPAGVFAGLRQTLSGSLGNEHAVPMLRLSLTAHAPFDSHPSLPERVGNLSFTGEEEHLLDMYFDAADVSTSAAEELLGSHLSVLEDEIDSAWREGITLSWRDAHQDYQAKARELDSIIVAPEEATKEQVLKKCELLVNLGRDEDALPLLEQIEDKEKDGLIQYQIGSLLLRLKDAAGTGHLQRAIELDEVYAYSAHAKLYEYFKKAGEESEAQKHLNALEEVDEKIQEAYKITSSLSDKDEFEVFEIPDWQKEQLSALLYSEKMAAKAWLVQRKVPAVIGGKQNVLVVKLPSFYLDDAAAGRLLDVLAAADALQGSYIMLFDHSPAKLKDVCNNSEQSFFYERAAYEQSAKIGAR